MKADYYDITSRLGEPLWWNDYGVPRYESFSPDLAPNIYAKAVALVLIRCQACSKEYHVSICGDTDAMIEAIGQRELRYGDPPIGNGCCGVGSTMNSIPLRVIEFWYRDVETGYQFARDGAYEKDILPDWALDHEGDY